MRINKETMGLIQQMLGIAVEAFSKKKKVRRILEYMQAYPELEQAFKSARAKIDVAEKNIEMCTLTVGEVKALDVMLDLMAKTAKDIKKLIPTI